MAVGGGVLVREAGSGLRIASSARTHAFPLPKLHGIPLFDPLVMPAVGAETREGEVHLPIELQLLGYDTEGGGALFVATQRGTTRTGCRLTRKSRMGTFYHLAYDIVRNVFDVVG